MNTISASAASAREAARSSDGRFGEQHHGDPGQVGLAGSSTDRFDAEHDRLMARMHDTYGGGSRTALYRRSLAVAAHVFGHYVPQARYVEVEPAGDGSLSAVGFMDAAGDRIPVRLDDLGDGDDVYDAQTALSNLRFVPEQYADGSRVIDLDAVAADRSLGRTDPDFGELARESERMAQAADAAAGRADRAAMALVAGRVRHLYPQASALVYRTDAKGQAEFVGLRSPDGVAYWDTVPLPAGAPVVRESSLPAWATRRDDGTIDIDLDGLL